MTKGSILPPVFVALILSFLFIFSRETRAYLPAIKNEHAVEAKVDGISTNASEKLFDANVTGNVQEIPSKETPGLQIILKDAWKQVLEQKLKGKASSMVLGNFIPRKMHPARITPKRSNDIALVTHCDTNKLYNLWSQLKDWGGPASVAIYIDDGDTQIDRLFEFIRENEDVLRFVCMHIYLVDHVGVVNSEYPNNILRNIAMDYSDMDFGIAADVDLIPGPPNCYQHLMKSFAASDYQIPKMMKANQTAMVMPAFDVLPREGEFVATRDQLPTSKRDLIEKVENEEIIIFHSGNFIPGHNATDFPRWYSFPQVPKFKIGLPAGDGLPPEPTFYPIQYQDKFEPYILVYKPGLPRYWEKFRGYAYNKCAWVMEMHRAGYSFATLTQQYFVHLSHNSTQDRAQLVKYHPDLQKFIQYLDSKYPLIDNRSPPDDKEYIQFTAGKKRD